jgi:hypothetical protein
MSESLMLAEFPGGSQEGGLALRGVLLPAFSATLHPSRGPIQIEGKLAVRVDVAVKERCQRAAVICAQPVPESSCFQRALY